MAGNRPVLTVLWHTTVVIVLLTAGYFIMPLRPPWGDPVSAGRMAASLLALGVLAVVLRREAAHSRRSQEREYHRIQQLLTALYLLVLAPAAVYAIVAVSDPAQFVGLANRTDALYFSTSVVTTVGFGDVHAAGALARGMVTVQMLFNLIYIGTALRVLTSRASAP